MRPLMALMGLLIRPSPIGPLSPTHYAHCRSLSPNWNRPLIPGQGRAVAQRDATRTPCSTIAHYPLVVVVVVY